MSTPYSESDQISFRRPRPLTVGVALFVFVVASTVAADPSDDDVVDVEEIALPRVQEVRVPFEITPAHFEYFTLIKLLDAFATPNQLDTLLKEKIALTDQICGLTDAQKLKLEMAGRGDNKRLSDRIEEIQAQFELVKNDLAKVNALHKKAQSLECGIITPGLSSDGSLFVKVLEQLLTAEQVIKYVPLRIVFRAGGLMRIRQTGRPDQWLDINLAGTAISDDDLAHLNELPSLKSLDLDETRITDSGLPHLKRLTSLKRVSLARTCVTVTGMAELHRALPDVTIEK